MSFGQVQLEKYGWNKGDGIGRNKHGIKRAITVSKKNDLHGIGVNREDASGSWWDRLYNATCQKVKEPQNEDSTDTASTTATTTATTNSSFNLSQVVAYNMGLGLYGGMFVKATSTSISAVNSDPEKKKPDSGSSADDINSNIQDKRCENQKKDSEFANFNGPLTDEQLFEACGKRSAGKGARADVSGKLARLGKYTGLADPKIVKMIEKAHQGLSSCSSEDRCTTSKSISKASTKTKPKPKPRSKPEPEPEPKLERNKKSKKAKIIACSVVDSETKRKNKSKSKSESKSEKEQKIKSASSTKSKKQVSKDSIPNEQTNSGSSANSKDKSSKKRKREKSEKK